MATTSLSSQASTTKSAGEYLDLEPVRVIGSGSFGNYLNILISFLGYVFEAYDK
jgi:hypothetical protein